MTAHRCTYCRKDCDSLPNAKGEYICACCAKIVEEVSVNHGKSEIWTGEEKEELYTNVFGKPPGVPSGEG